MSNLEVGEWEEVENVKPRNDFAHLHVHSKFSVRDALPSPSALVDSAKKLGFNALAMTDHGNMGSHYQFATTCAATETEDGITVEPIKAIFGVEAYLCEDIYTKEHITVADGVGKRSRRPKHYHIILLAKNEQGYDNLKEMSHISAVDGFYYEPRIDWNMLEKYKDGLICSSACLGGEIASSILKDKNEKYIYDLVDKYRQTFGDDFYLEIQAHDSDDERKAYGKIMEMSDELNIAMIATNDVHYIKQIDSQIHEQVVAMKFKRDESKGGSSDVRNLTSAYKKPEFFMKSEGQMNKSFRDKPHSLLNTMEIVEKCEFQYPLNHPIIWPQCGILVDENLILWKNKYYPELSDKQAFLMKKAMQGLKDLGLSDKQEYRDRLKYELNVIFDLGYEEYFITQWWICDECAKREITLGPARGSGASSLALYSLGITKLDPLKFGLIFERFLNPGRGAQYNHSLNIKAND